MRWSYRLRDWTVRSIHSMICGAALFGPASMAVAQPTSPITSKLSEPNFANGLSFDLPVVIQDDARATLTEVRLYTRTPTTTWKIYESAKPDVKRFNCKVPQDGEYWYSLVMVDRTGTMTPPDVSAIPPLQRVIVDTTQPTIEAQGSAATDGDVYLRCKIVDANPDLASLKAVVKTDKGDIPLEIVPNQPGVFRVNKTVDARFPVVVLGMDRAKNVGWKEVSLKELTSAQAKPALVPDKAGEQVSP